MTLGLLFWVLMILTFIFSIWASSPFNPKVAGPTLLIFVLLALLGWKVFGPALHG